MKLQNLNHGDYYPGCPRSFSRAAGIFGVSRKTHLRPSAEATSGGAETGNRARKVSDTQGGWLTTRPILARPARTNIAHTYSSFQSLLYTKNGRLDPYFIIFVLTTVLATFHARMEVFRSTLLWQNTNPANCWRWPSLSAVCPLKDT